MHGFRNRERNNKDKLAKTLKLARCTVSVLGGAGVVQQGKCKEYYVFAFSG